MKNILTIAAFLLLNLSAIAQTDPVRTEQDHIFQYIDKTQIPTGYLIEYGPEAVYKKWLTGVLTDSNLVADIDVFNFLYNDIENCFLPSKVSRRGRCEQCIVLYIHRCLIKKQYHIT